VTPVLSVAGVTKRYGAATVLSDVSLEIGRGEVVGLVGANGAGKSTLIRILSGVTRPTAGRVLLDGTPVSPAGPLEAQRAGVQTVHQHIDDGIVPGATVAENLILDGGSPARGWLVTRRRTREAAERVARAARLDLPLNAPVDGLPPGPRQQIVLARALAHRPRVLILDEPTSALSAAESDLLLATVRRLAADGVAVLYVSHRLQEIRELCDRVAVLRDGELRAVLHAPVEGSRLVAEMLGERLAAQARHEVRSGGDPVLRATGVRTRPGAEPFDLTVRAGEVVGLTGLIGAGKTELLEQLYGVRPLVSGALELGGRPYRPRVRPRRSCPAGRSARMSRCPG
jgi:simple sugar transport system ATP-binding protein